MKARIAWGFSLLVLVSPFSVTALVRGAGANLVTDGGFEKGEGFRLSRFWSVRVEEEGAVFRDTAHLRNGAASLCLRHGKSTSYSWARQDRIPVVPGSRVIVRCWVRGENLARGDGSAGARIYLEDRSLNQIESLTLPTGTFPWRQVTLGPVPVGNLKSFNLILYLHKCTGAVWFDDLTITTESANDLLRRRRAPLRDLLRQDLKTVRRCVKSPALQERLNGIEAAVDTVKQFADQLDFRTGPPYFPLHEQVYSVMGEHLGGSDGPRLVAVAANPWAHFPPLSEPRSVPSARVRILMARGEREQAALNLTACWEGRGRRFIRVRVLPEPLPGLRPLQATHVLLRDGRQVADALPTLVQRGKNTWGMQIHPGQTKQLWIEVNSAALAPGTHRRTLELTTDKPDLAASVPLTVRVLPLQMPREMPLVSYTYWWDYDASGSEEDVRMMEDHHVNGVFVKVRPNQYPFWDADGLPLPQDFPNIRRNRAMLKARRVIVWMIAVKWARVRDLNDPVAAKGYKGWIEMVLDEFDRAGVARGKLVFYLVDEPHGSDNASLVAELGRLIHEVDPTLKIWANPYHHTGKDDLQIMAREVGVWAPNIGWLVAKPENLEFFRQGGREVWNYAVLGRGSDPLSAFRMNFWWSMRFGLKGAGFFSWKYRFGLVWNDFDGESGDRSVCYEPVPWVSGHVTSKRWEAWREGAEDAMLHFALRQAISGRTDRAAAKIRQFVRSLPEKVTSAKPELRPEAVLRAREEMLNALAVLSREIRRKPAKGQELQPQP